ncbi:MAG: 1-acyl-sn-glycerol-3-phosphate acyltransferase [Thermoleophilaceae bacterium]|nr:1-acyl-sn-glycerol-3-phosphate acyltransferase [Thermoleophilaceae bacterium]
MKPQVYKDPRPAEYFTRFHERVRSRRPDPMYEVVRLVLTPILLFFYRARCIDSDKVPVEGPAVITPNHFSFLDHFFVAVYLRRKVHFMAKSQLFTRPLQFIYTHGGVFPVLRGRRDTEAFKSAHAILDRGDLIVMYAEGGRSRSGELGEAKPGIGRIALETGVPIVPAAIAGSQEVRNWRKLRFPKVTIQFGDPVRFEKLEGEPTREQSQAAADLIFEGVEKLYYGLQKDGRRRTIRQARRAAREAAAGAARQPAAS